MKIKKQVIIQVWAAKKKKKKTQNTWKGWEDGAMVQTKKERCRSL